MSEETVNPYVILGDAVPGFLDTIIAVLPVSPPPSVDDLVDAVQVLILALFYPSATAAQEIEIRAMIYAAVNAYINGGMDSAAYNTNQKNFIEKLSVVSLTDTTADTLLVRIDDTENNIPIGGMNDDEQKPLFIATAIGVGVYKYFKTIIDSPPTPNPWGTYLDVAEVSALVNLTHWTSASMEGALIGFKLSPRGLIEPTTDVVGVEIVSALAAALVVVAGKIIFRLIPNVQFVWPDIPYTGPLLINDSVPITADNRSLKVNGFDVILGNVGLENTLLQYAVNNGFGQIQLYDLYPVFRDTTPYPNNKKDKLANFILKARLSYGIMNIGCIMGAGTEGFQLALNYNREVLHGAHDTLHYPLAGSQPLAQFNIFNKESEFWFGHVINFVIEGPVMVNDVFSITINGTPYSYTAVGGESVDDIAGILVQSIITFGDTLINGPASNFISEGEPPVALGGGTGKFKISINHATAVSLGIFANLTLNFTNLSNIHVDSILRDSFDEWMASLVWLKPQLQNWQFTSAYIQNSTPVWDALEANQLVQQIGGADVIDVIEATNYTPWNGSTTAPNMAQEPNVSGRILQRIALAAYNFIPPKIQKFRPLFSAELDFQGYFFQNNAILPSENIWRGAYAGDNGFAFTSKANVALTGFSYFAYSFMSNIHLVRSR